MTRLLVALVLAVLALAPAWAGKKQDAERSRLSQEMGSLSERNAWKGVDRAYLQIEHMLLWRGTEVPAADHMLGARAARELGNATDTWRRLLRATEADPTLTEPWEGLARLYANFGVVTLVIHPKVLTADIGLQVLDMPFEPDKVRTITQARTALVEQRRYEGLLPLGRYALGSGKPGTVPFEIIGGPPVDVALKPVRPFAE